MQILFYRVIEHHDSLSGEYTVLPCGPQVGVRLALANGIQGDKSMAGSQRNLNSLAFLLP